ncbi:MAG: hypothetical protein LBQ37_02405 [Elusimicrobiota bacterium]|jgi:hypothetical protein|nr:hypothetical protein [Elusimicrobiota bacterium]
MLSNIKKQNTLLIEIKKKETLPEPDFRVEYIVPQNYTLLKDSYVRYIGSSGFHAKKDGVDRVIYSKVNWSANVGINVIAFLVKGTTVYSSTSSETFSIIPFKE